MCLRSILICAVLVTGASPALATQPLQPGDPAFGVDLATVDSPRLAQDFRLLVSVGSAQHTADCLGTVSLVVPKEMTVVSGTLAKTVHVSIQSPIPDREWQVVLRATRVGKCSIVTLLHIQCGSGSTYDETEKRLDFDVRADTVLVVGSYATRYEHVEAGERFRYGGSRVVRDEETGLVRVVPGHMVLIPSSEQVTPQDITVHASAPVDVTVPCSDCGLSAPITVVRVVTVGQDGRITWVEPVAAPLQTRANAVLEAALKSFRRDLRLRRGLPLQTGLKYISRSSLNVW